MEVERENRSRSRTPFVGDVAEIDNTSVVDARKTRGMEKRKQTNGLTNGSQESVTIVTTEVVTVTVNESKAAKNSVNAKKVKSAKKVNEKEVQMNNNNASDTLNSLNAYRAAGDWWEKFPKTDFTYSPVSPFHNTTVAPGVKAMPNMSRRSLHSVREAGVADQTNDGFLSKTAATYREAPMLNLKHQTPFRPGGRTLSRFSDNESDVEDDARRKTTTESSVTTWTWISTTVTTIITTITSFFSLDRFLRSSLDWLHLAVAYVRLLDTRILSSLPRRSRRDMLAFLFLLLALLLGAWLVSSAGDAPIVETAALLGQWLVSAGAGLRPSANHEQATTKETGFWAATPLPDRELHQQLPALDMDRIAAYVVASSAMRDALANARLQDTQRIRQVVTEHGVQLSVVQIQEIADRLTANEKLTEMLLTEERLLNLLLADGRLSNQLLANGKLSQEILANGKLSNQLLANGRLSEEILANGKLSNQLLANGKLSEEILANGKLSNQLLANGKLSEEILANGKLSEELLANGRLSEELLANGRLSEELVANGKLSNQLLANGKLSEELLSNRKLSEELLANGKLSEELLSNGKLSAELLANGKLSQELLANGKLSQELLANGKLSQELLANGKLSQELLANGKLSAELLANGKLSEELLANGRLSEELLANGKLTEDFLSNGKLSQELLANGRLSQELLANGKLSEELLSNGVLVEQLVSDGRLTDTLLVQGDLTSKLLSSKEFIARLPSSDKLVEVLLSDVELTSKLTDRLLSDGRFAEMLLSSPEFSSRLSLGQTDKSEVDQGRVVDLLLSDGVLVEKLLQDKRFASLLAASRDSERVTELQERLVSLAVDFNGVRNEIVKLQQRAPNTQLVVDGDASSLFADLLARYDADKTGRADFAMESNGGSVLSTRCSETHSANAASITLFGVPLWTQSSSPRNAIQPGTLPGQCWAFKGARGALVVQLSGLVAISSISIEHMPRSLSRNNNIDSAPRHMTLLGLTQLEDPEPLHLGRFEFLENGPSLQTFPLQEDIEIPALRIVELQIESNYGNQEYTCLYRFRVHGKLVEG